MIPHSTNHVVSAIIKLFNYFDYHRTSNMNEQRHSLIASSLGTINLDIVRAKDLIGSKY